MKFSIVVTTCNRKMDLLECIESIKIACAGIRECELIIVDDYSSDGTENITTQELNLQFGKILHNKTRQMLVKSRNIGARESTGEHILFVDDDNVIDKAMIKILVDFIEKNEKYGVVGPSMYYFDSRKKYLSYQRINLFSGKTTGFVSSEDSAVYESDGIPNVFMVRKKVFDECGYFDEILVQTFTEPDFAERVRRFGLKCVVLSRAKTYHKVSKEDNFKTRSMGGKYNQKAYCLMRNRTVYISRYGNTVNKIIYFIFFTWFWPLAYSLFAIKNKRVDLIKYYWSGFVDGVKYFFTGKIDNSRLDNLLN